jgi:DNA-binding PadR family transcriptional regulator
VSNKSRATNDVIALTVLNLLAEEPMHPYQIQRVIRDRHKEWAMGKTRSLYHSVDRLHADGLIEPVETSRDGKRPERTVYKLTEYGDEERHAWLIDLIEQPAPEHPLFLVAISFLGHLSVPEVLDALRVRAVALEGQIAGVEVWQRALRDDLRLPRPTTIEIEFFIAMHRAELAWVRSIADEIQGRKLHWDEESLRHHFATTRGWSPAKEGETE